MTPRQRRLLAQYAGRIIETDGRRTVELRDPDGNSRRRFQYRLGPRGGLEQRILSPDGTPYLDTGSPWEPLSDDDIAQLYRARGTFHPILDPLTITPAPRGRRRK